MLGDIITAQIMYGLVSDGETVAVMDSGFNTSLTEFSGRTVTNYNTPISATSSSYHGNAVAGIAVGGGTVLRGVAYTADLYVMDYANFGGTYWASGLAGAVDGARSAGSIVLNNSWGLPRSYCNINATTTNQCDGMGIDATERTAFWTIDNVAME